MHYHERGPPSPSPRDLPNVRSRVPCSSGSYRFASRTPSDRIEDTKEQVMAYRVQKGGLILSLGFALALGTTPALATHDRGLFQLDRNAKQSILGNGTGDDWDNVLCTNPDDPTTCSTTGPGPGGSSKVNTGVIVDPK